MTTTTLLVGLSFPNQDDNSVVKATKSWFQSVVSKNKINSGTILDKKKKNNRKAPEATLGFVSSVDFCS